MSHLQMGTPEQFAALREHFLRTGFSEASIRQRLEVNPKRELDLPALSGRPPVRPKVEDSLDAVVYLFVLGVIAARDGGQIPFPARGMGGSHARPA